MREKIINNVMCVYFYYYFFALLNKCTTNKCTIKYIIFNFLDGNV